MEVIYLDVLIILNIYIGYFLLISTRKLMNLSVPRWRMILASLLSGGFSMVILLNLSVFEQILTHAVIVLTLCFTAFYRRNTRFFGKIVVIFVTVSFVFGGLIFALYFFLTPSQMVLKNGICYFDISTLTLVIFTVISYIVISAVQLIMQKRCSASQICSVKIKLGGKEITTPALLDSGNKLVDIFTGLPIMVCELKILEKLLSTTLYFYLLTRGETPLDDTSVNVRVVSIGVVSGETSLMAFKPQEVIIDGNSCNMLVAVTQKRLSDGTFYAIVGC